jgi:hypothetical protein
LLGALLGALLGVLVGVLVGVRVHQISFRFMHSCSVSLFRPSRHVFCLVL